MIESPPYVNIFNSNAIKYSSDKNIQKDLNKINNEYYYWTKIKYLKVEHKGNVIEPNDLWATVKLSRFLNYKRISFGAHEFSFVQTDYIQEMLHFFDMNIGGTLSSTNLIPESRKQFYLLNSIMEESIASSKIEGAVTTRKKAKDMLRKEEKPRNKSEQMIVNNYETIQYIVKNKDTDLTPELLLEIQRMIANNTLDDKNDEGRFRADNEVFVVDHAKSEVVHTPPCHTQIPQFINELCAFFNTDNYNGFFIHPIIKGIIIHFMIGYIHPFCDGNGRTARALFYWYLLKKGYWLTEYLSISRIISKSKTQYEQAYLYTENDQNDLTYFIRYNVEVMQKAFNELKAYLQRKMDEENQNVVFLRIPNINERQAQILKTLNDKPNSQLTVKEIENRFTVSNNTAREDLNGLVKAGFIEAIPVNKVKTNYIRSAKFSTLINKYLK